MKKIGTIAARHWKALLAFNTLVALATLGSLATAPRVWTAKAQLILPATTGGNLDANLGTLGSYRNNDPNFSSQVNPLKIQQTILTSDAVLERAWKADPDRKPQEQRPRGYGGFFNVSPLEQTSVMVLSVQGASPEIAQQRSQALLKAYQQRLNELRQVNNSARENFSQKQLDNARQQLATAQANLATFKQATGLVNDEEQTRGIVKTLSDLKTAQAQAQAQAESSSNRAKTLSQRLQFAPGEAVQSLGLDQNQDYKFLRLRLTEVEANLARLRARFTDESPTVRTLLGQRDELRRQLERYVAQAGGSVKGDPAVTSGSEGRSELIQQLVIAESEANGQARQAAQLQSQINQLQSSLKSLPKNQARLAELQRQADVAEGVYKGLVAQVQQYNIDAFSAYPNVQVLDPPVVDRKPSSPKNSIAAINALFASIIGSIALILLLEARNPLLSPKDIQSFKFPLIARIGRLKPSSSPAGLETEAEVEFQRLASAISLQSLTDHRILITSAMMGEGKTTVALQLATALTDLGFRVLLVDGDFRKAELSQRLGYIPETSPAPRVALQPNLDFLPTRPRQGRIVDLVARGRFEQYLITAQSTTDYDYVLVDSAPVGLTSETSLMAAVIPNVLFVVRPGISARNAVSDGLEQLTQHHARVLGLVLNGVEPASHGYPYRSNATLVNS